MEDKIPVLDLIFVIDSTASMDPMIEFFNRDLFRCVNTMRSSVNRSSENEHVRVRFLLFRDLDSPEGFLHQSPLFDARDSSSIKEFASTLRASGGGDLEEDGFAALVEALRLEDPSDEEKYAYRKRKILLFSDADTKIPDPSLGYPTSVEELADIINEKKRGYGIDVKNLRIVLFAPKNTRYQALAKLTDDRVSLRSTGDLGDGKIGLLWNDPRYIMSFC